MNITQRNPSGGVTFGIIESQSGGISTTGLAFPTTTSASIILGGTTKVLLNSIANVPQTYKLSVAGLTGSSGVFASLANPFGVNVLITDAVLRITTQSTAASTVDIGVGADATTSNDGCFDGLSAAAAGVFSNALAANLGTNGKPAQYWSSTTFLNVAEASGNVDALVADLYVTVVRI